jgi:hypothetical protein
LGRTLTNVPSLTKDTAKHSFVLQALHPLPFS